MSLSDSANLCVDDTKESGKAFWTLVNFNSSPAVTSLSIRVNGDAMGCVRLRQTYQMPRSGLAFFRLCRVWLRPGLTGMLVRCMLSGTRFVVSAPKHKRKHSPTRLPDRLGYRLHRECNAVPERTFVSDKHSRCPPPAAWRLSHRVAEYAEVYGRTQIGATYHVVLRRELPAIRFISTLELPFRHFVCQIDVR